MRDGQTTAPEPDTVQLMEQFRAIAHASHNRTNARMNAAGLSLAGAIDGRWGFRAGMFLFAALYLLGSAILFPAGDSLNADLSRMRVTAPPGLPWVLTAICSNCATVANRPRRSSVNWNA